MSHRLIGMVHLGPLPGSPAFSGDLDRIVRAAVSDARVLAQAGFDAVMIENFGDTPYFADEVPPITVAAMSHAATAIAGAVDIPIGINVLRNDARAALAIAASCGGSFIRVNVLSGIMYTDQGLIAGRAAEIARMRTALAPHIQVLADVFVKHATPPPGATIEQAAADTYRRAGADALVISGTSTGSPTHLDDLAVIRGAVPEAPLLAGSGVSNDTIASVLEYADGVIVGTSVKVEGKTTAPVDPERAGALVRLAGG
jgi:membrane complex biogenesis BtpA family protein